MLLLTFNSPIPPHVLESAPFWVLLLEQYAPIVAAAIAVVVLGRSGFTRKLGEYRRDTVDLLQLRANTLEKELADALGDNQELQREIRSRERRIEMLEEENEMLRDGDNRRPLPRPPRSPRRPSLHQASPEPPRAPDVDDRGNH